MRVQGGFFFFFFFFMIISVFEAENERLYRVMESAASGVVSFDTGACTAQTSPNSTHPCTVVSTVQYDCTAACVVVCNSRNV